MRTEFDNIALFGQAEWSISDSLTAILGLRYTDDEVSFRHNRNNNDEFGRQGVGVRPAEPNSQFSAASGGFNSNFAGDTDETNLSGRLGLNWQFGESHSLFANLRARLQGSSVQRVL